MKPIERKKLGEILILQKLLTPMIVERVIRIAKGSHRRLGQTLEDMGLLTAEEISQALSVQYGYKIVTDICRYNISPQVLGLVTLNEAVENRIYPLDLKEGRLALAMADPTNLEIVSAIAERLNLQVVIFIATTQEIMKAIAKNYLGEALKQKPKSLLIVNSDPGERQTLTAALNGEGYKVFDAVDAEDGFRQALLQQPSLVITAKDMPFTDGFAFLTRLHAIPETKRIPVILLSQRPSTEEEAIAMQRGFFDYIPMPAKEITLFARVKRALAAGKAYNLHQQDTLSPEIVLE